MKFSAAFCWIIIISIILFMGVVVSGNKIKQDIEDQEAAMDRTIQETECLQAKARQQRTRIKMLQIMCADSIVMPRKYFFKFRNCDTLPVSVKFKIISR